MDYMSAIISLGSAIIGYSAKVVGDYFLENKKQKEKEKQFKREKLEEIFILFDKERKIITDNASYRMTLTYEDAIRKNTLSGDISTRTSMLIRFYFEDIKVEYENYIQSCSKLSTKILDSKETIGMQDVMMYMQSYSTIIDLLVLENKKL